MVNECIKIITKLSERHEIWETWSDCTYLWAAALSNAYDKERADAREAEYLRIISKYQKEDVTMICKLFAKIVCELEKNQEQDILGEVYMQLSIYSKQKAQHFTPYYLSEMMAKMTLGTEEENNEPQMIYEPTCGSGVNLISAANIMRANGINYQQNVYFVAQDLAPVVARMCYIQMSLLGMSGMVLIGDTLKNNINEMERWYTPFHFLFGQRILTRARMKSKEKGEKETVQEKKEQGSNSWLLDMVGVG